MPETIPTADRVGVVHVDGKYHFTTTDYLNEGAAVASRLGTNVLKVWFRFVDEKYPFGSDWPRFESLVGLARHRYVRALFERGFQTYVLVASSYVGGDYNHYFREGVTDEQYREEVREFYDLTAHLLRTYRGTGTEFVLQNWESDWAVVGSFDPTDVASEAKFDGLTRWLNARQEGIRRARADVESDVTVLGAVEVNRIRDARTGVPRVVDTVLPNVDTDLVSVSLWDVLEPLAYETDPNRIAAGIRDHLDYVRSQARPPTAYARRALGGLEHVYVGELGWPLEENGPTESMRLIRTATETALRWGARYVLYWQVFDNERSAGATREPPAGSALPDVKGFYLIRPDGTRAPTWDYFARLFEDGLPDMPDDRAPYVPVTLEFERTVAEHTVNASVAPADSRDLAVACSRLELVRADGSSTTYDVGTPSSEPIVGAGAWEPEGTDSESWRWLGGPAAVATFYVPADSRAPVSALRLRASSADGPTGVVARVGDASIGRVTVDDDEWLGRTWIPASTTG